MGSRGICRDVREDWGGVFAKWRATVVEGFCKLGISRKCVKVK